MSRQSCAGDAFPFLEWNPISRKFIWRYPPSMIGSIERNTSRMAKCTLGNEPEFRGFRSQSQMLREHLRCTERIPIANRVGRLPNHDEVPPNPFYNIKINLSEVDYERMKNKLELLGEIASVSLVPKQEWEITEMGNSKSVFSVVIVDVEDEDVLFDRCFVAGDGEEAKMKALQFCLEESIAEPDEITNLDFLISIVGPVRGKSK